MQFFQINEHAFWPRIQVTLVSIATVLQQHPFLLFYQLIEGNSLCIILAIVNKIIKCYSEGASTLIIAKQQKTSWYIMA